MNNGNDMLELGTSLGISTMFIGLGAADSSIITIEGCSSLAGIARENFKSSIIGNITLMEGDFEDHLPGLNDGGFNPSLVFVDGNHSRKPVLRYFSFLKKMVAADSVIIFDDINYSFEMSEAWNEIKTDPQVSVSIDIFRMGFVFFRKGMAKQDFKIRY
ncbi:MAG: class I SAM-dependent methyltransferase [Bacteroidales bacterium]|nr:class I SAM-dependent methyltransferase [Bacteroidales bacterium]